MFLQKLLNEIAKSSICFFKAFPLKLKNCSFGWLSAN